MTRRPVRAWGVGTLAAVGAIVAGVWSPRSHVANVAVAATATRQPAPPAVTLLYQNFPNPFPSVDSRTTCIWFDLAQLSAVSLTIHDVRGNLVRRLLPRPGESGMFVPGRYGRAVPSSGLVCNPGFSWDGRAQDGSIVPRGVYLIRLRANRTESIKKALFQGP